MEAERNSDNALQPTCDVHFTIMLYLVGLDGWHLWSAPLDVFSEPQIAYDRKDSHWTFDGALPPSLVVSTLFVQQQELWHWTVPKSLRSLSLFFP